MTFWLTLGGFGLWAIAAASLLGQAMQREPPPPLPAWLLRQRRDRSWLLVVVGLAGLGAGLLAAVVVRDRVAAYQSPLGGPIFLLVPIGGTALGAALAAWGRPPY